MRHKRPLLIINIVWWLLGGAVISCFAIIDPKLFYFISSANRMIASGFMRLYAFIIVPILIYAGIIYYRAHKTKSPRIFDSAHIYVILSLTISVIITLGSLLISALSAVFTLLFPAMTVFSAIFPVVCLSAIGAFWSYIGLKIEKSLRKN